MGRRRGGPPGTRRRRSGRAASDARRTAPHRSGPSLAGRPLGSASILDRTRPARTRACPRTGSSTSRVERNDLHVPERCQNPAFPGERGRPDGRRVCRDARPDRRGLHRGPPEPGYHRQRDLQLGPEHGSARDPEPRRVAPARPSPHMARIPVASHGRDGGASLLTPPDRGGYRGGRSAGNRPIGSPSLATSPFSRWATGHPRRSCWESAG